MDEVVRVLPRLGRRGRVPVPGRGVDDRVVHPVPLAVQDVVTDLHVLEDLGQPERARTGHPGDPPTRGEQQRATQQRQTALERDDRADVGRVTLAQVGLDLLMELVELAADLLDLLRRQAMQGVLGLRVLDPAVARAVVGACCHVLRSPKDRSRSVPPVRLCRCAPSHRPGRTRFRCADPARARSAAPPRRCGRCPRGSRRAARAPLARRQRESACGRPTRSRGRS